jgi:hypothetical protein
LDVPNILAALPDICGDSIASECNVVRKQGCNGTHLAAAMRIEDGPEAVLADGAGRQKRHEEAALRIIFMNSGISKPFD